MAVRTFERNISRLEDQLQTTLDASERDRLLRLFIKELSNFARNDQFRPILEQRITARKERIKKQRARVATKKYRR